ncbi:hypothetical protein CVT25_011345 [Psilocybe cyanescens]|uniref:N-acetyltransferase domain-containing protein n=1 Tax=Psilocybe cyanescens TaxID=93625 RepID=A0A409WG49_PSICY|nr:hypothetical protein CVT25_011345 [Psilocybe cyanescens]
MFTTARLRLRGSMPSDAENLLALYNDERVAPWITEGYIVPKHATYLETINAFIASCILSCVVEETETGDFVGLSSFVGQGEAKNRNAIMCIALMPRHWSKGYGAEVMSFLIDYAFHDMNMHRVSLTVFEGNERAMELYRRLLSSWMMSLPSHTQVSYETPSLPVLLSLSAYLYLLSFTSALFETATNAPLLGPLLTGILLGPSVAGLLTPAIQQSFIDLGYIGLLLIVFEAGLSTHLPLLLRNAGISCAAALTGILLPIALSMALLRGAYSYTVLQAFAAGAALCSTSLGTTLALLTPALRRTRVGSVLMCAALLDDVVGLVVAGIIPGLADAQAGVRWETIVRPVLVSVAFAVGTPLLAWVLRKGLLRIDLRGDSWKMQTGTHTAPRWRVLGLVYGTRTQLFCIVLTLSAFVAGTKYAGTSELFGAYLAGAFLAYIFTWTGPGHSPGTSDLDPDPSSQSTVSPAEPSTSSPITPGTIPTFVPSVIDDDENPHNAPLEAFNTHLLPILSPLLGPIFFASIGAALPVGTLFTIRNNSNDTKRGGEGSHSVVWRGIVYSVLMVLAKMGVGVWMFAWPEPAGGGRGERGVVVHDSLRDESGRGRDYSRPPLPPLPSLSRSGLDLKPSAASAVEGTAGHGAGQLAQFALSGRQRQNEKANPDEPTRKRAAALLGLAMVARGEIALIIAQLARPLLVGSGDSFDGTVDGGRGNAITMDEEPFAVVIWAILISTVGGALGVGVLLGSWKRRDGGGGSGGSVG